MNRDAMPGVLRNDETITGTKRNLLVAISCIEHRRAGSGHNEDQFVAVRVDFAIVRCAVSHRVATNSEALEARWRSRGDGHEGCRSIVEHSHDGRLESKWFRRHPHRLPARRSFCQAPKRHVTRPQRGACAVRCSDSLCGRDRRTLNTRIRGGGRTRADPPQAFVSVIRAEVQLPKSLRWSDTPGLLASHLAVEITRERSPSRTSAAAA